MKIRTDQELFDKLDIDLSWRKADLIRLRKLILDSTAKNDIVSQTLLRSAVPLIYSHWEGFIKEASLSYLNFVALRKFKYNELQRGFLSLYIQSEFLSQHHLTELEKSIAIFDFFEEKRNERSNIKSIPDPIKTKANLNSEVLLEIITVLELDYEPFRLFEKFIDSRLLDSRNKIAHGEFREIDRMFYDELHSITIRLLNEYKHQIQNAVAQRKYYKQVT